MSDLWTPNKLFRVKYICLWQRADGSKIMDADKNYLCAESFEKGDKTVEFKMRQAAASFGIYDGQPIWQEGEKISDMERDDQMERYLDGKIPDPKEEYRVRVEDYLEDQKGGGTHGVTG